MLNCPFEASQQLYGGLVINPVEGIRRRAVGTGSGGDQKTYLPGCPQVQLKDPEIGVYLQKELMTHELNKMAPHLWLVAKQDSEHISPLTEQIARGRNIIITEKPRLHLVWFYDRVFIKPLPKYLLSRAFWDHYLLSESSPISKPVRDDLLRAALGLLRSYAYLIQHKSDYAIAQDEKARLVPKRLSYSQFVRFIELCKVSDDLVSPRFRFGELRLTRLNIWSKVFLWRFRYAKVEWQYGAQVARHYAPALFIFAVFAVLLGAMQVTLAVQALDDKDRTATTKAYREFSLFIFYSVSAIVALLVASIIALFGREVVFALNDLTRKGIGRARDRRPEQEAVIGN